MLQAFYRALAYRVAGKDATVRAALQTHEPTELWKHACATWLRSRLSPLSEPARSPDAAPVQKSKWTRRLARNK